MARRSYADRARQEQAGLDLAWQLAGRAALEPHLLADALNSADPIALRVAVSALAVAVGDVLTPRQLSEAMTEAWGDWPCHPATWGASWASRAEHGTRARYNAGCRGQACCGAVDEYDQARGRPAREPGGQAGPALRAVADGG